MKKFIASLVCLLAVVTLFACSSNSATVTMSFETNEGSAVASITAKPGEAITKPADPTKADLTFGGWYADVDLSEPYEFPQTMPSADVTLYAKWNVTLTFDSKGGSSVDSIVGAPGSVFKMPADPVREGYVFVGWYLDSSYETKLTYVMPKKNTTVVARWQVFEKGSAIDLGQNWLNNDAGAYDIVTTEEGTTLTATAAKSEWAFAFLLVNGDAKANTTLLIELQGTKDVNVVLKLEGGNAEAAIETTVTMTGEPQTIEWTVESKNLTSIGGQKFLCFLNGGTAGASETPEYVTFKSVCLYRTVEADAPQRSTISFVPNGGTPVETYYLEPGTPVSAPETPVKEGFNFLGWFTDPECTQSYEFSVMPETALVLYAGWKLASTYLADCDLMGGTITALDAPHYVVENNPDSYKITKTSEGSEWTFLVLPMTDKKLAGYNVLRVEMQGTAGQEMMFKINDQYEVRVVCTGEVQTIEIPFDIELSSSRALVLCALPGVAGESGTFTITKLAYGNYSRYESTLKEGWASPDAELMTIKFENGVYTVSKLGTGYEWSCIIYKNEGAKVTGLNAFRVKVQGTAGEKILFKINDINAGEVWVTCDGTVQTVEFDLPFELDPSKNLMVVMPNAGSAGTSNPFTIYECGFFMKGEPVEPVEPVVPSENTDVNLLGGTITALDEGNYEVTNEADKYTIKKISANEWTFLVLPMTGKELTGLNVLRVEIKGTAGQKIMLKINDANVGERVIEFNGSVQLFEFTFDFALDPTKPLVFCVQPGYAGNSDAIEITKLEYSNYVSTVVFSNTWVENDPDTYTISSENGVTKLAKNAGVGEWVFAKCDISESGATAEMNKITVALKGAAGTKILVKVNNAVEKWVDCDGTLQTIVVEVPALDVAQPIIVFAEGGSLGTGAEFEIHSIKASK